MDPFFNGESVTDEIGCDICEITVRLAEMPKESLRSAIKALSLNNKYMLMNTCQRFQGLLSDPMIWDDIDGKKTQLPFGILAEVLERAHEDTHSIKIRGPVHKHKLIEASKFTEALSVTLLLRAKNLSVLELYSVTIDVELIKLRDFPRSLKRLILGDCKLVHDNNIFFENASENLINLEEFGVDICDWFRCYYISELAKMSKLRWLRLRRCNDFFCHHNVFNRYAFAKLEYVDLRGTRVNDYDVNTLRLVRTLKEIVLENNENKQQTSSNVPCEELPCSSTRASNSAASSSRLNFTARDIVLHFENQHGMHDNPFMFLISHRMWFEQIDSTLTDGGISLLFPTGNNVEKLTARNYINITDEVLRYLMDHAPRLEFLDLSNTGVSPQGVLAFRISKPNCVLVVENYNDLLEETPPIDPDSAI